MRLANVVGRNHFTVVRDKPDGTDLFVLYGAHSAGNSFLHPRDMDPKGKYAGFVAPDLMTLSRNALTSLRRRLQIVFQNPYASLNPRFTVAQILLEPMRIHRIEADDAARIRVAAQLLKRVGLPESALNQYPHEFSGGQRQRIAIARCLTMKPEILVCDESVSALDVSVQAQVLNLLQDLQDEYGMSYIFISHDLSVVKYMADQVMVILQGSVVVLADSDELYRHPQHAYTRALLSAIPGGV